MTRPEAALLGMVAVRLYQLLGLLSVLAGGYSVVRGDRLPGRLGSLMVPRSQEWEAFLAGAPPRYWRLAGMLGVLFGLAIVVMGQGCFHGFGLAAGLPIFVGALVLGLIIRDRYGPYPPRTKGWWWRYALTYSATFITAQWVIHGAQGCQ